jgi:predicted DCC family thiol-disulfide oxidoreductase YuxK
MNPEPDERVLTAYFNGACPVCSHEMHAYEREPGTEKLGFCDVVATKGALADAGLDDETLKRRLHVRTADGKILVGIDAFTALWDEMPRWRPFARIVRYPLVKPVAELLYDRIVSATLYRWAKAREATPRP